MNPVLSRIWPVGGNDRVTNLCRRTYPWLLSIYLGTAPYYYVPGVPDDVISALKILCFLLAAGTTSVAALSSGSSRTPGGLLGPLGFAVLAVLSLPGVLQGNLHWSADYAADLVHAAAFCWLFFWIVRSGEGLRRILVSALAILYGILAIQVVSMLAASDWHWSRLCGFSADDPFRLYNTPDGSPAVIGLWLPAGALFFARRPAWSPWLAGAGFLLTALVLAAQFMATSRIEILITAGLSAALLLRSEIRAWAAGMLLGVALVATTAMVSFAVFEDHSCFYHLDLDQQALLFGDEPQPAREEPLPPRGKQPHPSEMAIAGYDFTAIGGVMVDERMVNGTTNATVYFKADNYDPSGASGVLTGQIIPAAPGATISQAVLDLGEGGQGSYTVVLDTRPTGEVTVRARSSDPGRVALTNATLTFSRDNWNVPQTVGVNCPQDIDIFHDVIAISHTASSSDAAYGFSLSIAEVAVKVYDDEAPSPDYEPVDIQVTPGDGTLKVDWKANPRPGLSDGDIRYGLRWSQTPYVWANPPDQCSATAEDGIMVPPGTTEYTIEGLRNGVAAGVYVRSFTVSGGVEIDGSSSSWVRLKGVNTTPAASLARLPTLSPPQQRAASGEAGLSALRVTDTFLEPSFNSGVTAYRGCEVPFRVTSTHVTATVKDTGRATVKVGLRGELKSAVSGRASAPVQLSEGPNVIDIEVTAEDGVTRRTYTVTVEREASPADIAVNPVSPPSPSRLPEGPDSEVMERWMVATSDRLRHYLIAFDSIAERPLLGHGFGAAEARVTEDLEVHNLWLKFAAYTGVLWPAWFALMVSFLFYRGGQLLRLGLARSDALLASACAAILAGALLLSMTSPGFFIGPANINTVIWMAAGIILGLHSRLSPASAAGSQGRTPLGRRRKP